MMNGWPVVIDIGSAMRREVVWSDCASFAVRLGIVRWDAKLSGFGVVAKIVVEGVVLLAGDHDMLNNSVDIGCGCWPGHHGLVPATCGEGQAGSRERSQCSQHAAPGLMHIEQLLEVHDLLLSFSHPTKITSDN